MVSNFKIILSSDMNYDELCAEIFFDDQFVAILTQEQGIENMELEIHPSQDNKPWVFKFSDFEAIIKSAKEALWEMRKSY